MLFTSIDFLLFFPLVTLTFFLLPQRMKNPWLLAASLYFYMCWNAKYVTLLLASTLMTWLGGLGVARAGDSGRWKKLCLIACLILNLGMLSFFKYMDFFSDSIEALASALGVAVSIPSWDLLLPVGISFFTFRALGYVIDVYRGDIEPERSILNYALFVSFFPQLVAGPIERYEGFSRQLRERRCFDAQRTLRGLELMAWGFFEKLVVADRIALTVNAVYGGYTEFSGLQIAFAVALFTVQLFCDFCGYSDIAAGAAQILGFEQTTNFRGPLFASTVSEFWRRWHISLTSWFRDYVYIPLGGNRHGRWKKYRNLLLTFGLSGLWHGADWSFVVWGLLNGVYQVIGDMTSKARAAVRARLHIPPDAPLLKVLQCLTTDALAGFAFMFFRADSIGQCIDMLRHAGSHFVHAPNAEATVMVEGAKGFIVLLVSITVLLTADYLRQGRELRELLAQKSIFLRYALYLALLLFILIFGLYGPSYDAASFIYCQF